MPEVSNIEAGSDTFRILLTTDNHVGYMENDQIRGDDSWKTFAEILNIGRQYDVDMIVQGGDLFHINAPTKKSYYHVMRSLRENCWCNKPIEYKLVSDPSDAMATKHFGFPAEYDENVNVGMPLYAISGNHDDATGEELLSPLDVLSVSGLLNHFGRVIDNERITVCPLLFNKGKTNLALYGLHSIREERLMKTMASGNLEFLEPATDEDSNVQWFNLMCIHQNHVHRPGVKVVEETSLPSFLDFVLWGHEHDCKPVAVRNDITGAHILQAGSSIATSLSEGETLDKHVYILSVKGKDFSLEPIKLKSVRPFVMRDVVLSDTGLRATSSNKNEVLNFLTLQVELMIQRAKDIWKHNNIELFEDGIISDKDIPLPLIRLRVEYSGGYEVENPRFFSNRFVGKVANINDVVLFYKKKKYSDRTSNKLLLSKNEIDNNGEIIAEDEDDDYPNKKETDIMGMISNQLDDNELIMLTKKKASDALENLLEHDEDKNILARFVRSEEDDHIELLQQLSLEGNENDHDGGDLLVTKNVKDVKKSFKELAKRIKAETQYNEVNTTKVNGPMLFHGKNNEKLVDSIATSTHLASSNITRNTGKKAPKSEQFVVNSDSESESESEQISENRGISTPLFDISPPSLQLLGHGQGAQVPGPGRGRGRGRGRPAISSNRARSRPNPRVNNSKPDSTSQQSNLDILLGRR